MRLVHALATALAVALTTIPATVRAQEDPDHEHAEADHHEAGAGHDHGGFPEFVDVFFTHHAYLERKLHPSLVTTRAEEVDTWTASAELAWQFTDRLGGEIEVPVVGIDPEDGDGEVGLGDVEVAPMVALVQDSERGLIVTARSGFVFPTGDAEKGLGEDGWAWEPGLSLWKGFGADGRGALQAEVGYDRLFADEGPDEQQVIYNLALTWWLPSNFVPVLEINGASRVGDTEVEDPEHHDALVPAARGPLAPAHGGTEAGEDTLIAGTIGFRYAFANEQQWGAGVQVPLNGGDVYDVRIVVGGIVHLH